MIRLNYSSSGVTNPAVFIDTEYTGSTVKMYITSSFTGDVTTLTPDIISNKSNQYGGWLLLEINRNLIPTESGQYDSNIYEVIAGAIATWNTADDAWNTISDTWVDYALDSSVGSFLVHDRTLISGSDYDAQDVYEYQEKSNFIVYNG